MRGIWPSKLSHMRPGSTRRKESLVSSTQRLHDSPRTPLGVRRSLTRGHSLTYFAYSAVVVDGRCAAGMAPDRTARIRGTARRMLWEPCCRIFAARGLLRNSVCTASMLVDAALGTGDSRAWNRPDALIVWICWLRHD